MLFNVTINVSIETEQYHKVPPTEEGVKELVQAMWDGDADMPEQFEMKVEVAQ
jgi:hypothetical protein